MRRSTEPVPPYAPEERATTNEPFVEGTPPYEGKCLGIDYHVATALSSLGQVGDSGPCPSVEAPEDSDEPPGPHGSCVIACLAAILALGLVACGIIFWWADGDRLSPLRFHVASKGMLSLFFAPAAAYAWFAIDARRKGDHSLQRLFAALSLYVTCVVLCGFHALFVFQEHKVIPLWIVLAAGVGPVALTCDAFVVRRHGKLQDAQRRTRPVTDEHRAPRHANSPVL